MKTLFLKVLPLIIITAFVFWATKGLFKYDVNYTQDLKRHLSRSYDSVITLSEGSFPLRWGGILNYECGVPMYNFYNPLPYYFAALGYAFTGRLLLTLKLINLLALLFGSVFFYAWMLQETKSKLIALGASVVYLFSPYTFLLMYVRGSPEYLSYSILPIVLFLYSKAFASESLRGFKFYVLLGSAAGAFLLISHNLAALLCICVLATYLAVKIFLSKNSKYFLIVLVSFVSIFGLSAFYILPAAIEKGYTKLDIPIFEYQDHFPTLGQLINSPWGYGDSGIGLMDGMSFQLGYAQWIILGIGLFWFVVLVIYKLKTGKKAKVQHFLLPVSFLILAFCFLYLILPVSLSVWKNFGILQTFQFSWRLIGICTFVIAAFFGFLLLQIGSRWVTIFLVVFVSVLSIIGNRNHMLSQPVYENDLKFYRDLDVIGNKRRFLSDFSDTVLSPNAKVSCYLTTPLVQTNHKSDKVKSREVKRGSTFGETEFELPGDLEGNMIVFNLGYFPEIYDLIVNDVKVDYSDCEGLVCIEKEKANNGVNIIEWKVGETNLERLSNYISIAFGAGWVIMLLRLVRK